MKTKVLLLTFAMAFLPNLSKSQTWHELGQGGFSEGEAYSNHIGYDGNTVYAAYIDDGDSQKLSVKKYNGTSWEFVGSQGFTDPISYFDFAIENGNFYIVTENAAKEIKVLNLIGGNWQVLGNSAIAQGSNVSLCINAGVPYIAFEDWTQGNKVSVKKMGSNGWEYVGAPGFSPFSLPGILDIEASGGTVYIAARDESNPYNLKATVMKFDGTQWNIVGTRGFSGSTIDSDNPLALYNGVPYVVAWDDQHQGAVYKFNGTNWVTVGNPFSVGISYSENLKFSPQGNLYVAYTDDGKMNRAELKKFNGSTWESIGGEISKANAEYLDFTFNQSETPFMTFQDGWYLRKTTVMTFDEAVDGIENHSGISEVFIYPNPVNEKLNIHNNTSSTINELLIYDQLGQQVSRSTIPILAGSVRKLDVSTLSTGIYFIQLKSHSDTEIIKLIKR